MKIKNFKRGFWILSLFALFFSFQNFSSVETEFVYPKGPSYALKCKSMGKITEVSQSRVATLDIRSINWIPKESETAPGVELTGQLSEVNSSVDLMDDILTNDRSTSGSFDISGKYLLSALNWDKENNALDKTISTLQQPNTGHCYTGKRTSMYDRNQYLFRDCEMTFSRTNKKTVKREVKIRTHHTLDVHETNLWPVWIELIKDTIGTDGFATRQYTWFGCTGILPAQKYTGYSGGLVH